jgi:AraC family transcriptional regulator
MILPTMTDYIMANLDRKPTLEQMAGLVRLSPITSRGNSKRELAYAARIRNYQAGVQRAQQLLCGRQDISLVEVALTAGFSDQSQFSFHFKRIVGVTPGQFRASKLDLQRSRRPGSSRLNRP